MTSKSTPLRSQRAAVDQHADDSVCINTIRTLAIDAVQKANSGHPGTPMALAPVVYTLWQEFLRYDPADPLWPDRDRFVLSAGHASMLLYAMLHLARVRRRQGNEITDEPAVSLDDIKRFRQIDSVTPGHPEYGLTTGVEATTGPLGQGCGNSVGMAIASRWLAAHYNRPGFTLFDHDVYASGHAASFGVVEAAQARGDFDVLTQRGRRALRVHLKGDVDAGLAALEAALERALG